MNQNRLLHLFSFAVLALLLLGALPVAARIDEAAGPAPLQPIELLNFPILYKAYVDTRQWNSVFALRNPGTTDAQQVQVTFYDQGGTAYQQTPFVLPAGTSQRFAMADQPLPDNQVYSAIVQSDQPLAGVGWLQGVAGVESHGMYLAFPPAATAPVAYMPWMVKDYGGATSKLSVQNLNDTPMNITVDFYNEGGSQVGQQLGMAPPYSSWHLDLSATPLPTGFRGTARVSGVVGGGAAPLAAMTNNLNPTTGTLNTYEGFAAGSFPLYLPQLFDNFSGLTSALTVQNVGDQPTQVTVTYSDGAPPSSQMVSPNGAYTFVYNGGVHPNIFGAVVSADQPLVAVASTAFGVAENSYEAFTESSAAFAFPVALKSYQGVWFTGLTVQNTSAAPATVLVTYEGFEGEAYTTNLAPGAIWGVSTQQEPFLPGSWAGSLKITSDQPVIAVSGAYVQGGGNGDQRTMVRGAAVAEAGPPDPVAGFASNSPVCLGEVMVFTNTTTGTLPIAYTWDFGDGGSSNLEHPTHTYSAAGTFGVSLEACNSVGCDTYGEPVQVLPQPTAGFTYAEDGLTITFSNTSSDATTYLWAFGDGATSTEENPVHTYAGGGDFVVALTATNNCGEDLFTDTIHLCDPVEILSVTTAISGCVVDFGANLDGEPPFTYAWDFGPYGSSASPTTTVDFLGNGTYDYALTVMNCGDAYSDTAAGQVTVNCGYCAPPTQTMFTATPADPELGTEITFAASSQGSPPITFAWDLGDGTLAAGETVTHTYGTAGTFTIVMTATNCGTETVVVTDTVTVQCNAVVDLDFTWWPTTPQVGAAASFTGTATGTLPIAFAWDLGDGITMTGAMITHTYAAAGTFTVTLMADNVCGQPAEVSHLVTVVEISEWRIFLPLVARDY